MLSPALYYQLAQPAYNQREADKYLPLIQKAIEDQKKAIGDQTPSAPMSITPSKKDAWAILGGEVLNKALGGKESVYQAYMQGRQIAAMEQGKKDEAKIASAQGKEKQARLDQQGAENSYSVFSKRAEQAQAQINDAKNRAVKSETAAYNKSITDERILNGLRDDWRNAKTWPAKQEAAIAYNNYATSNGRAPLDPATENQERQGLIAAKGQAIFKAMEPDFNKFGEVPEEKRTFYEEQFSKAATELGLTPEELAHTGWLVPTASTLRKQAQGFAQEKWKDFKEFRDKKWLDDTKFRNTKYEDTLSNLERNYQLAKRRVEEAERRGNIVEAKAMGVELGKAAGAYSKTLNDPKTQELIKEINKKLVKAEASYPNTTDPEKRLEIENRVKSMRSTLEKLGATVSEVSTIANLYGWGEKVQQQVNQNLNSTDKRDTRMVGSTGKTRSEVTAEAIDAVARGADKNQVNARLRGLGVPPIP